MIVADRTFRQQRLPGGERGLLGVRTFLDHREHAANDRSDEAGARLFRNIARVAGQCESAGSLAFRQGDFRALGEDHRLVAPRLQGARLIQRLGLKRLGLGIAARRGQAEPQRLQREHFRVAVADPHRRFAALRISCQPGSKAQV